MKLNKKIKIIQPMIAVAIIIRIRLLNLILNCLNMISMIGFECDERMIDV